MKKRAILVIALLLFILSATPALLAQEQRETIAIKSSSVNNGVVILVAQEGKNSFDLQCNKNVVGCAVLGPGTYLMVRLPQGHGIYDCANVDIYRTTTDSELGDMIGQYCLVEEK